MAEDPKYHEAPYTLDASREIPEDALPAAGTYPDQAEKVKAADDAITEQAEAEAEAEEKAAEQQRKEEEKQAKASSQEKSEKK